MACLDTSILIDLSGRGGRRLRARARAKVKELTAAGETLVTTRFNVAELWVGISRARDPAAEQEAVERVLAPLTIVEFDQAGAETFGRLTAYLQRHGAPIGDMDVLIASVALGAGHAIVTRNTKHFGTLPGVSCHSY